MDFTCKLQVDFTSIITSGFYKYNYKWILQVKLQRVEKLNYKKKIFSSEITNGYCKYILQVDFTSRFYK